MKPKEAKPVILEQESQLLAQIKDNQLAPIYLLYGEEQYLKEFYAKMRGWRFNFFAAYLR